MENKIEQVKNDIESFLMDSVEHQNKNIDYILFNPKTEETITIASDGVEEMIEFAPYTKDEINGLSRVPDWDFNFDGYLFEELQKGYQIGYMSPDVHYSIWNSLNDLYPEDLENKDGIQKYLQYCKDNNITKKYLDKEVKLDTPDVMQFLTGEPLSMGDVVEHKGYVAQVNEENYDNPEESIVFIYKSKQDMIDGNYIEQVSLANDTLKNDIREYIDDNYDFKESKTISSDESYITFILGYEMIRDVMKNTPSPESDVNYEFCNNIAKEFMQSNKYQNSNYSMYEMLSSWVVENKSHIQSSYDTFVGKEDKERIFDNGIRIIDSGNRKDQPVALIEKSVGDEKQYVVAFNYRIQDNKIDWAYGYYYDNDIDKAKRDFEKVKTGGNLSKTFENKDKER